MKDRITHKDKSIVLDHIIYWEPWPDKEILISTARAIEGEEGEMILRFNNQKERDAFLARLDNYFQEIP